MSQPAICNSDHPHATFTDAISCDGQRIATLERDLTAAQARIAAMETLCNKRYRKLGDERQCQFCRWFNGIHQEWCPVSVYDATLTAPDSGVAEEGELSC